ncbi:MAG TPA: ATP-dependent DNA helicase RecG, partial [Sphingomicrobium sp.]|nr:ATP-dependent DNA helicase RecG [Sphingomicrobium sp.]
MRPELLNPLFAEVEALKGVGPNVAKALARLGITRVVDLAFHLPVGTIERVRAPAADPALVGRIVILEVTPFDVREGRGRSPLRIYASDAAQNTVTLTFFNNPGWARKQLPLGQPKLVTGKLDAWGQELQMVHPEVLDPAAAA